MKTIDVDVLQHCYNPNPRSTLSIMSVSNGAHSTAAIVNNLVRVTPATGWSGRPDPVHDQRWRQDLEQQDHLDRHRDGDERSAVGLALVQRGRGAGERAHRE
jgi:hypothetical protein